MKTQTLKPIKIDEWLKMTIEDKHYTIAKINPCLWKPHKVQA